jgi:hypothetical protein
MIWESTYYETTEDVMSIGKLFGDKEIIVVPEVDPYADVKKAVFGKASETLDTKSHCQAMRELAKYDPLNEFGGPGLPGTHAVVKTICTPQHRHLLGTTDTKVRGGAAQTEQATGKTEGAWCVWAMGAVAVIVFLLTRLP